MNEVILYRNETEKVTQRTDPFSYGKTEEGLPCVVWTYQYEVSQKLLGRIKKSQDLVLNFLNVKRTPSQYHVVHHEKMKRVSCSFEKLFKTK